MKYAIITICLFSVVLAGIRCSNAQGRRLAVTGERHSFEHADIQRAYRIHVPQNLDVEEPVPLVLMLHGGGGNADQASRMGMSRVANENGFIVLYPEGLNKHWNDGRHSEVYAEQDKSIDDVAYIDALIHKISKEHEIDRARVFVTGVSNGGFMTQRLAIEKSNTFSAAATIIASMPEPLAKSFAPELPVSMLFMCGTEDPLVPYDGGEVVVRLFPRLTQRNGKQLSRGNCTGVDKALGLWLERNELSETQPTVEQLTDKDSEDGSTVEYSLWSDDSKGTSVGVYRVVGGGHNVPGGFAYLPERVIGKTNRDIEGLSLVWQFFKDHARVNEKTTDN